MENFNENYLEKLEDLRKMLTYLYKDESRFITYKEEKIYCDSKLQLYSNRIDSEGKPCKHYYSSFPLGILLKLTDIVKSDEEKWKEIINNL